MGRACVVGAMLGMMLLWAGLAGLLAGCATHGKATYTSGEDYHAVQEMEWNFNPWR